MSMVKPKDLSEVGNPVWIKCNKIAEGFLSQENMYVVAIITLLIKPGIWDSEKLPPAYGISDGKIFHCPQHAENAEIISNGKKTHVYIIAYHNDHAKQ